MKSLVCTVLIATALALSGNAASAARVTTHVTHRATHYRSAANARQRGRFARPRVAYGNYGWFDIGGFIQAMLGGRPPPYAMIVRGAHSYGAGSYSAGDSPVYDNTPVASGADDTAQQAIDEVNEINMENSMQATQEQNDEANAENIAGMAAAEQTEINSGM